MSNMEIAEIVIDQCLHEELVDPQILESVISGQYISDCLNRYIRYKNTRSTGL